MAQNLTFNLDVDTNTAVSEINQFFQTFEQGAAQASSKLRKAFSEPLKTEVEISLKNGELIAKKIESTKSKTKQLKDVYKALNGEIGKTPNALKKQMQILKQLQGNTEKYKKGTNRLSHEWKLVEERIRRVKAEQDKLTGTGSGGGMDNFIGKFALVQTAANLATAAIMNLGRAVQELGATGVRMELLMLQLEAFTGGAEQAQQVYTRFAETARATPFNVEEVAQAGKIMMAFGVDTETAAQMTDRLAIAASATGGDINNLGRNLGQIAAQGQAYTRDLHQFAMQGLPIWDQMSEVTGKSVTELKKLATEGKISFDIVAAAIQNMTKEGSAFEQISKRMQETFAGRFAMIETAATNLSLSMIEAFNRFDQATGQILTGSMKQFAEFLESLAKKAPMIGQAVGEAFAEFGSFLQEIGNIFQFAAQKTGEFLGHVLNLLDPLGLIKGALDLMGGAAQNLVNPLGILSNVLKVLAGPTIVIGIGLIIKGFIGLAAAIYGAVKAKIVLLGLSGPKGWAILGTAAVVSTVAITALEGKIKSAAEEQKKTNQVNQEAVDKSLDYVDAMEDVKGSLDDVTGKLKEQAEAAKLAADQMKMQYDEAKAESDKLKESIVARIELEKSKIDEVIDKKKDAIQQEKDNYASLKDAVTEHYDNELSKVNQVYDAKLRSLDLERDALGKRGPKEQELYELRKRELEAKIQSGQLDERATLEAEARLERMGRQEKMEQLAAERKKVQLKKEKEIKRVQEEKKAKLDEIKKANEENVKKLEDEVGILEDQKGKLDEKKTAIEQAAEGVEAYNGNLDDGISRLRTMISETQSLKSEWEELARIAKQAKLDANAAKQANASNSSSGGGAPTTSNFAGGPIAAGTKSWVNELGKEAFLSASGRLSMINDRNGQWTAPTDGTIIPAHLTSQLSIPTGGVNLNKAAAANASRAGAGGMSAMVRAIKGSMGGDTFNQNVTVQAANPVQAANNMMVEMTRLKRRRLG